jgi:Integron Cassette Protein Hfx_Cass5
MTRYTIEEVGIDEEGRLYVRPSRSSFEHIWRAAMEVNWDAPKRWLFGPKPREWNYVDWFRQIVAAAADEYGTTLSQTANTNWFNVPSALRAEIEAVSRR